MLFIECNIYIYSTCLLLVVVLLLLLLLLLLLNLFLSLSLIFLFLFLPNNILLFFSCSPLYSTPLLLAPYKIPFQSNHALKNDLDKLFPLVKQFNDLHLPARKASMIQVHYVPTRNTASSVVKLRPRYVSAG